MFTSLVCRGLCENIHSLSRGIWMMTGGVVDVPTVAALVLSTVFKTHMVLINTTAEEWVVDAVPCGIEDMDVRRRVNELSLLFDESYDELTDCVTRAVMTQIAEGRDTVWLKRETKRCVSVFTDSISRFNETGTGVIREVLTRDLTNLADISSRNTKIERVVKKVTEAMNRDLPMFADWFVGALRNVFPQSTLVVFDTNTPGKKLVLLVESGRGGVVNVGNITSTTEMYSAFARLASYFPEAFTTGVSDELGREFLELSRIANTLGNDRDFPLVAEMILNYALPELSSEERRRLAQVADPSLINTLLSLKYSTVVGKAVAIDHPHAITMNCSVDSNAVRLFVNAVLGSLNNNRAD